MKNTVLAISLLIGSVSFAQVPVPGAITRHTLSCTSVDDRVGVDVSLECYTQALAPQYSLRGCSLIETVVAPGAQPTVTVLNITSQDAREADLFYSSGGDFAITAKLDKLNLDTALNVYGASYLCHE